MSKTTIATAALFAGLAVGWLAANSKWLGPARAGEKTSGLEVVDTRIGKLELENGYPTARTFKKLCDEADFQRACQLHFWGLPAVGFHGVHQAHLKTFGAADGDVVV